MDRQRRDLCGSCYRKLHEAKALPPRRAEHRDSVHPLRRWLTALDTPTLMLLRSWIEEMKQ